MGKKENPLPVQTRVRSEQIRLLFRQLKSGLLIGLAVAAVLAAVSWGVVSHRRILLWTGLYLTVSAGRFVLLILYKRTGGKDEEAWAFRFITGAFCAGLAWGLAGILLMPRGSFEHQLLLIFILAGVITGASLSLSVLITAYALFCLPVVILPIAGWIMMRQGPFPLTMSVLLVLFAAGLILLARHLNTALLQSFRLRFEKTNLIDVMKREIGARKKSEKQLMAQNKTLEMLAKQYSLEDVLRVVNETIEAELPGAKSSILILDDERRHLLMASAPTLPEPYSRAIHGTAIGPKVGSCGAAAFRDEPVIVEDIAGDPLWRDYRDLALSHGLRACWSSPIHSRRGEVLGTFALYYDQPRRPDPGEINKIQSMSNLAGIAIEQKRAEKELQRRAYYDTLTNLPNRALFLDRLEQAMARGKRWKQKFALLFIDLDKFKIINDTLGHEAGDRVLQEVAGRLHASVRENDTVARLGGDEFTTILMEVHGREDALQVAQKILETLRKPVLLDGENFKIGGSIGVSMYPEDGEVANRLLSQADTAMYRAKQNGGNTIIFCSSLPS